MTSSRPFRKYIVAAAVLSALLITDEWHFAGGPASQGMFISTAEAVIGRPLTPYSVAGVARRTTRRVIRRSTVYVAALPAGCVRTTVNGSALWLCGGVYYQAYSGRYVVVYVN